MEWLERKPCWMDERGTELSSGCRRRSMYGEVIWSNGKRITAVLNSLRNNIKGEVGYQIIKRTLLEEPPLDNPGGRVADMGIGKMNCLAKSVVISMLRVRDLEEKMMG